MQTIYEVCEVGFEPTIDERQSGKSAALPQSYRAPVSQSYKCHLQPLVLSFMTDCHTVQFSIGFE